MNEALIALKILTEGLVTLERLKELAVLENDITLEELDAALEGDASFFVFSIARMKAKREQHNIATEPNDVGS